MAFNFLPCDRDQPYLLPPSLKDWLPQDHLAFFLLDAVKEMDLRSFYVGYREDGWGAPAFEPTMMVTLLLYAYCIGERSSRRIERRCQEDIAFRVITANSSPDHSTIARFRQENEQALSVCFTQVLGLCAAAGLVRVGVVALDGTKLEANASLYANRGLEAIDAEVQGMLAEAAATDRREDELVGPDNRGDELPEGLRSREGRLRRLRECKARLEAEDVRAKYEAELTRRAAIEAETGRRPVGRPPKLKKPTKNSVVANTTDPDSRVMKRQYTYLQGYNAQAVVSEDHIILAATITQDTVDLHQLHPMLHQARANLAAAGIPKTIGVALADSGYYSEANLATAEQEGPELLVAVVNERDQRRGEASGKGVFKGPRGRVMQGRLATERGRTLYTKRAHTVEPVFGHIKDVRRVRRFARRGLGACDVEWKLVCATHNLLKLWRHSRT
ncbi:MAG: transposase [Actinomycetota bacterium]